MAKVFLFLSTINQNPISIMSDETNKISLDKAKKWTKEWRDDESDYNKYNECNAFLIPIKDLKELLAEMGDSDDNAYVRAYLGVEKKVNEETHEKTFTEKLAIVGTRHVQDSEGKWYYQDRITDEMGNEYGGGGGIYDFTRPCPPNCDDDSPLN